MTPPLKKKLYVGCAINNLPPDKREVFLKMILELKNELRRHFTVLDFLGTATGSPQDTYTRDIVECVGTADCMLAIWDYPSGGLGYETCFAVEKVGIPVLGMAHTESSVSRLILGIHGESKKFVFFRYVCIDEIVSRTIRVFLEPTSPFCVL